MSEQTHIYRVSFREPVKPIKSKDAWDEEERTNYFFGSLSAIYEMFSPEQIGCKVSRLWNLKISGGNIYDNRLCTISREPIFRMKQNTAPTTGDKSEKNN